METLERWLYPVPPLPKQVRQKPMEVLALGMSRSGTESLRRALFILGYDHVYHGFDVPESSPPSWEAWVSLARRKWGGGGAPAGETGITREDLDGIIGHCNAITDQQGAMFALEMAEAYPEAKVILNRRETQAWYRSVVNTFGVTMTGFKYHVLPYFSAQLYWRKRYYEEILGAYFHGSLVKNGSWMYREHCAKIRGLVPPDRFLEWEAKDGWEPLCKFLGKDIPTEEFPSGNTPDLTIQRISSYMEKNLKEARRNFAIFCSFVFAIVSAIVWQFG